MSASKTQGRSHPVGDVWLVPAGVVSPLSEGVSAVASVVTSGAVVGAGWVVCAPQAARVRGRASRQAMAFFHRVFSFRVCIYLIYLPVYISIGV